MFAAALGKGSTGLRDGLTRHSGRLAGRLAIGEPPRCERMGETGFMDARSWFDRVAVAARDAEYIKARLPTAGAGLRARRMRAALAGHELLLSAAYDVCFGADNDGGVARGVGRLCAEVVWRHYAEGETFEAVAEGLRISRMTAYRYRDKALAYVEGTGLSALTGLRCDGALSFVLRPSGE